MSRGVLSKNHFFCDLKSATDHDQLLKQGYKHVIILSEDPRSVLFFCDPKQPKKFDSVMHFFAGKSDKENIKRTIDDVSTYLKNLKKQCKLSGESKICFVSPEAIQRAPTVALGCMIKDGFINKMDKKTDQAVFRKFLDDNFKMHDTWKDALSTILSQK